jgi:NADPH-dependent 2,4-dienoyl-CoA reductase/sulfur reductase-like enzyme/rhodanese-related sulfurtransferase
MRLIIVGGVAGGMSCAARARRLDESAEIIVLERGDAVSFANCGLPYFVGGEIEDAGSLLVQTPEKLEAALSLDVRTNHDVIGVDTASRQVTVQTPSGTKAFAYDALVLSPGAQALRPPLPGLDSPRVHTLRTIGDALELRAAVTSGASRAVVLGAGFIGVEAAEALRRQGLSVDVVELFPHVLPPMEPEMASLLADEMRRNGMTLHEGIAAAEVVPGVDEDVVVLTDGTRLPADLIVLSVGVRPDTAVFEAAGIACERGALTVDEHGRTSAEGVWAVGDAVASIDAVTGVHRPVALAGPANRAGRLIADDIFHPETARPVPHPVGTAIVRMGALTAAMTGANRAALDAASIAYETVHLHPNHHAGYFPGAQPIHLVIHFARTDGLVLGAQAVGATVIRNRMPIGDLIDLDLSYSPPYGQAKDPINLAGMEGDNVLSGVIRLWYPADLDEVMSSSLVLDVRSAAEFATGHLSAALNIPHTELRGRLDEVRSAALGRPVRVMCASGVRSYIAHRVLTADGFDSATLSGGMQTLRAALPHHADALLAPTYAALAAI